MEKTVTRFGEIEIEKQKLHSDKIPISIKKVLIKKILVSNKVSSCKKGFKYFIGYKDAKKIRPLSIFLPKMSAYRRGFNETKYIMKFGKNLKIVSKKNLIVNLFTMKNI